jgi:protocadherin Fat 1/2/3
VSIRENEEISTNLMVIQVVNFGNDPLIFDLMNGNDNFIIGQTSGVLQTKRKKFDREHCNHYDLVVKVQDFRDPPHVAHVVVNVDIEDQNDNSPVFLNQPYDTVVSVNTELGAVVRQVSQKLAVHCFNRSFAHKISDLIRKLIYKVISVFHPSYKMSYFMSY